MKKKTMFLLAAALLLLLQVGLLFYYGNRKAGFHEDEFYSYYSTNKTAGLFVNDREWMERDSFYNDFVVLKGEQFRYDVVAQMQSWDVHPPVYYFILHTVCSLFPGVFSKWLGIGVNIIAFIPCFILLWYLVYSTLTTGADKEKEKTKKQAVYLAFLTCLFWGFGAAVISGVMFIRMYQWLTLFVLACACLHIKVLKKEQFGAVFLIPLGMTVYLGFLTQYYYIIFHFFLGAGFCFILLRSKKLKELLLYIVTCAVGLGGAILSYPASMAHIFRGYRGTEAVDEFSNISNTWERLRFFFGLFDDYMLHGTLYLWLLLILLLLVTVRYIRKRTGNHGIQVNQSVWLLLFSCAGYFFTVSKTALLLGETSNRYQLPVYGMLVFLILYFLCRPVLWLAEGTGKKQEKETANGKRWRNGAGILLAIVLLLIDVSAWKDQKVFFLYEEEKPIMEFVKEKKEVPAVVFYNEASEANVWRLSDELMEFPRVYLASQGNAERITDSTIVNSRRLLVYVADYDEKEKCLENLLQSNPNLGGYQEVARKNLFTLYLME